MSNRVFDDDTLPPDVVRAFGDITPRSRPTYRVAWGASSAPGSGRGGNEDVWGQRSDRAFVVADGMGGREGGAGAAAVAVAGLLDELSTPDAGVEWVEAIHRVNELVLRHATAAGRSRVGAAAAALRYAGGRLTVLHLGDVRAYRLRAGQVELLTIDHTLGEELDRAGLPAANVRDGLPALGRRELAGLTTFFGDPGSSEHFSVRSLSVQHGDRIALCTDGVHRHVPTSSWKQIAEDPDPTQVADVLVGTARANGTTDDATSLVVAFSIEPPAGTAP